MHFEDWFSENAHGNPGIIKHPPNSERVAANLCRKRLAAALLCAF
jgi:hypothetical protein